MKKSRLTAALLIAVCSGTTVAASEFPGSTPIRFVVPWTAGSATDSVTRYVGDQLSRSLNVPVVVENRPGASGIIGTQAVSKAKPDGHTLLVAVTSHLTNPHFFKDQLTYDTDAAFEPIILMTKTPAILWVTQHLGIKTLDEVTDLAKKEPGKLVYASSGIGNTPHLTAEMFKQAAKLDIRHSPYKGAAASVPDVVGGHVPLSVSLMGTFQGAYKAGQVVPVAVASEERMDIAPEIPTFAELGFPDVLGDEWFGVLAPAGTPEEIIQMLNKEIDTIMSKPEAIERLETLGMESMGGTPEDFASFMDTAKKRWNKVIVEGDIRASE